MKRYFLALLLLATFAASAQQLPPYERSRQNQVLSDRAAQAKIFFALPPADVFHMPGYVPDSIKAKSVWIKTGTARGLYIYNPATNQLEKDGKAYADSISALKESLSNKATDFTTVNNTLYPTVLAAKNYADGLVVGLLNDRGSYDASSNVYPSSGGSGTSGAILKGNLWAINGAGTLGGVTVGIGDWLRALTNAPGQTAANWSVVKGNFGYVPENIANKQNSLTTDGTGIKYPTIDAVNAAFTSISTAYIQKPATPTPGDYLFWNGSTWTNKTPLANAPLSINVSTNVISVDTTATGITTRSFANRYESLSNKQTNLTASATKYPTVDAVNTGLGLKLNLSGGTLTGNLDVGTHSVLAANFRGSNFWFSTNNSYSQLSDGAVAFTLGAPNGSIGNSATTLFSTGFQFVAQPYSTTSNPNPTFSLTSTGASLGAVLKVQPVASTGQLNIELMGEAAFPGYSGITTNAYYNSGWVYRQTGGYGTLLSVVNGNYYFLNTPTAGTAGGAITWSTSFAIFNNGNVGVGYTTDQGYKLAVNGTGLFAGPITTTQYKLSALNSPVSTSTSTGEYGEIRWTSDFVYLCTATNTWKRFALSGW